MIVAHLIGGNEINGIRDGIVIVNGETLQPNYRELSYVCGNISLGDLDTSITLHRSEEDVQNDYIDSVIDFDDSYDEDFVIDNYLIKEICYSEYSVDLENGTLVLTIDTY